MVFIGALRGTQRSVVRSHSRSCAVTGRRGAVLRKSAVPVSTRRDASSISQKSSSYLLLAAPNELPSSSLSLATSSLHSLIAIPYAYEQLRFQSDEIAGLESMLKDDMFNIDVDMDAGSMDMEMSDNGADGGDGNAHAVGSDSSDDGAQYEEMDQSTEESEDVDQVELYNSISVLLDDFLRCNTQVLKNFARARVEGNANGGKADCVLKLVEAAFKETTDPRRHAATRRVLGDDVADAMPADANLSTKLTDSGLEASMLENACEKMMKGGEGGLGGLAQRIRAASHGTRWISQRLLRQYQDDYDVYSQMAVGNIYRAYRDKAAELLKNTQTKGMADATPIITTFATLLNYHVNHAFSPNLICSTDIPAKLVDVGIIKPTVEESNESKTLERLMEMLDPISEEIQERFDAYGKVARRFWGTEIAETLQISCRHVINKVKDINLDDVPAWVIEMVAQFNQWETIIRNDIPALRNVPDSLFDALFIGVCAVRALMTIHGEHGKITADIPGAYCRLVVIECEEHLQNMADDVLIKLNLHVQVDAGKAVITNKLFDAIYNAMQATAPDVDTQPDIRRIALLLREFAASAGRMEKTASLQRLATQLSENLVFHLRFLPVYEKMNQRERHLLRTSATVRMNSTLAYFEERHSIEPVDSKAIVFLVLMFLFFCMKQQSAGGAVLTRFSSAAGREELSLVAFAERKKGRLGSVRVPLPPQLTRRSWLNTESNVYQMVPASAVKSPTSGLMLTRLYLWQE